ncbi:MAG: two pore domain potassium channel family protein [Hyphomonas sp.]|nr:two pore domain potassium channel family protein [Hyphomonas sp.]
MMLFLNLLVASILVVATFSIHFGGLVGLTALTRQRGMHPGQRVSVIGQGASILGMVVGLFALHSIEIWVYALAYMLLGEFNRLETALYFATSTFTTVGFGDVILSDKWRMLSAAESMNGFLLIGWSTAFLVTLTARVRAFEEVIEHLDD